MNDLPERLAADTLALIDIASESRAEDAILDAIRTRLVGAPGLHIVQDHDSVLVAMPERRLDTPLVLLAGHVDTVPLAGARRPGRRDGDVVAGRGAADMKGALAVMLACAADGGGAADVDLGYLFFGREEIPINESALIPAFDRTPELREVALAIVMEPTDNELEVGCNGNLNALVRVRGRAAHSARPWHGDNAIHAAIEALAPVADHPIRDVEIDGLVFREVVSVTTIAGGIAGNVVPDLVEARVNLRYAPNHTPAEAETRLRELLGHGRVEVEIEIVGNGPPGPVCLGNPLVQRLRAAGDLAVRPKQAWTPVAEFGMVGVDAVNLGPGDPRYAHTDDEQVTGTALARAHAIVSAFLADQEL
ncbi:MAG: succinyl-diaminopimelate desuccinylase [Actinomycetota bacterium]